MVKETHKLIQDNKTREYKLVSESGKTVELGTGSLRQAKKRSLIIIQNKRKNNAQSKNLFRGCPGKKYNGRY